MWIWWFMLACDLLIPALMLLAGRSMWKHCPKRINSFYGYRTKRSMKNPDTWEFAHSYCGRLWWRVGIIMLPLSGLAFLPIYHSNIKTITIFGLVVMMVQCVILLVSIFPTERALKKTFNEDGTRK